LALRLVLLILIFGFSRLHADVGLLMSESLGQGTSKWTSAGHSSIYFSRLCPETPVKMRLCAEGEEGSVLTNYHHFSEDKPYEWNLVPLSLFVMGVENEAQRPLYATPDLRRTLQERYKEKYLGDICQGPQCDEPQAEWRDLVASSFVREIYMFHVKTTLEQDLAVMAKYNSLPNESHYNGITRNCADFARGVINTYFPNAARPDHINDFGITSPKAIAKSFSHYGRRHPELEFHVIRFAQLPGHFRRSDDCRKGTEVLFRSKKWLFPLMLKSHELAMFAASYMLTGRFNPDRELHRHPTQHIAELEQQRAAALAESDPVLARQLAEESKRERDLVVGTKEEWKDYSSQFNALVRQAVQQGVIKDRESLRHTFRTLDRFGATWIDQEGLAWLDLLQEDGLHRAGMSAGNINSPGSEPRLAYLIMLARVDSILASHAKDREIMTQFKADWALLERTYARLQERDDATHVAAAASSPTVDGCGKSSGQRSTLAADAQGCH
jgi:hypothetical protein